VICTQPLYIHSPAAIVGTPVEELSRLPPCLQLETVYEGDVEDWTGTVIPDPLHTPRWLGAQDCNVPKVDVGC